MKSSKANNTSLFFTSLLLLINVSSSFSSPQINNIANLKIETVPANGEYRINIAFILGYPFYKCRRVIENMELYPEWFFKGVNELGRSRLARLTQKNFHFVSQKSRDSLVFDYDVRILFFHFRGNLDISLNKSVYRDKMEGRIRGVTEKPTRFVKRFKGELRFKKLADDKTSVNCEITIRPASYVYKIISPEIVKRVVISRLTKICENLNKEVFTSGKAANI